MKRFLAFLVAALLVLGMTALAEETADRALYAGFDPWGNPLSVTLFPSEALDGVWNQNFGGDLFTQAFENAQDGFALEGPLDDGRITCRYSGVMALDGNTLTVTFSDGEMTEESTEGGSTGYHVAPLSPEERTVTLALTAPGDYSIVTTLDPAAVEAFAARVRQLYLYEDWYDLAELIQYPIALGPEVEISDAAAFVAYMEGKAVSDDDMAAMASETCVGMMCNYQGICLGDGELWLRDLAFDGVEQASEPTLRIIAINGLAD